MHSVGEGVATAVQSIMSIVFDQIAEVSDTSVRHGGLLPPKLTNQTETKTGKDEQN